MVDIFRIPNAQDISAGLRFGARWFELDTKIIGASAGGFNGVVAGGEVTEAAVPDMTVDVAAPRCVFNGVAQSAVGAAQVHSDADATFPRIDVIILQGPTSPELGHYEGVPAETPVPPDVPGVELGTEVVLAYVLIPAGDTAITQDQIIPKAIPVGEPFISGADWTTLVAADESTDGTRTSTATLAADSMLSFEMAASTTYRIRARVEFDLKTASRGKAGFTGPAIGAGRIRLVSDARGRQYENPILSTSISEQAHSVYDGTGRQMSINVANYLGTYTLEGTIRNGATTGDFAITWAQLTAVAEPTVRLNGSVLEYLTLD